MKRTIAQKVTVDNVPHFVRTDDLPKLKEFGEKLNRIKPFFSILELRKSDLPDTKNVADILFEGKVIARMLLSVTNSGGKKDLRSVQTPNKLKDFKILRAEQKISGIPFNFVSEDREYKEVDGKVQAMTSDNSAFIFTRFSEIERGEELGILSSTRHFKYDTLEEVKDKKKILKNRADNLVGVPPTLLEEYIFENIVFEPKLQYA